ncbi:PD-(D/E)XK nuclease family protein [Desulfosudis oleivorans]|uniref:PD-(D/E)XK nuclease superfamily protein n=1 Tax=Desulfosudis oleivorans (strain DSM 6200 / JCM 39069 / Hxd3) TaxID=96561 RepID=A8ZS44_DESOH|nr:PD-(D/E)XK nuclease family protein [Desulfosudis oleivorans]ABW66062.1 conserved hypothetical protein [Desulfosudis oleivorans Hxd3]
MHPNLFHFATSELSQDAVLCWLLSWAENNHRQHYPHLHKVAKNLLDSIYQRSGAKAPAAFSSIEIRKQDGGIDILCIINHEMAILIEDKAGMKQHSDQLARYKEYVFKKLGFAADKVIQVYIQTGDQSDYSEVEKHGYQVLRRLDLLDIFEDEAGLAARSQSDIFRDFSDYLRQEENEVQSYLVSPPSQWSWNAWKGFYAEVQQQLQDGNWDYVPNPAGGFLGFWWHFVGTDEYEIYLQLEQENLCFKIFVENAEKRRHLRQHWYEKIILKCSEHGLKARRPGRFGNGRYMTVAIMDQDYRAVDDKGIIKMAETLKTLKAAQSVMDGCMMGKR